MERVQNHMLAAYPSSDTLRRAWAVEVVLAYRAAMFGGPANPFSVAAALAAAEELAAYVEKGAKP